LIDRRTVARRGGLAIGPGDGDGATIRDHFKRPHFSHSVPMPAIMPGLVVAGFFAFIVSWSQYVLTLQIGGGKVLTLPVLLVSTASGGDVAITGALTIVYALPVVVLLVVTSRQLVRAGLGVTGT